MPAEFRAPQPRGSQHLAGQLNARLGIERGLVNPDGSVKLMPASELAQQQASEAPTQPLVQVPSRKEMMDAKPTLPPLSPLKAEVDEDAEDEDAKRQKLTASDPMIGVSAVPPQRVPGQPRFGVLSVTRTAAMHLFTHVQDVYCFLKTNKDSQWMTDHKKQILFEVNRQKSVTQEADAQADAQAAEYADSVAIDEIEQLFVVDEDDSSIPLIDCAYCASGNAGDGASFTLDDCFGIDNAPVGSVEHVQRVALDLTVHELILGSILPPLSATSCAICCKKMCIEAPPSDKPKPAPLPDLSPSTTTEEDAFLFVHGIRPPDMCTWIHWHTMVPCGHQVHTMCLWEALQERSDDATSTATCPTCDEPCSGMMNAWWFGRSVTADAENATRPYDVEG